MQLGGWQGEVWRDDVMVEVDERWRAGLYAEGKSAASLRAWYTNEMLNESIAAAGRRPSCSLAPASGSANETRSPGLPDDERIDVGFFDSRVGPAQAGVLTSMRRIAATINGSGVRFHAILVQLNLKAYRNAGQRMPGFRVTTLMPLPEHVRCVYEGLRSLAWRDGAGYLYKPLLHWLMPLDVRRLLLLDLDIVVVRDLRAAWAHFRLFGSAVIGVAREQSELYEVREGAGSA